MDLYIYVSDRHKILLELSVETLLRIQFYLLNAEFHLMSALNNGWGYNTEYEEGGMFLVLCQLLSAETWKGNSARGIVFKTFVLKQCS